MLATGEIGRGFEKMQLNGSGGVEISKEEIPGIKRGSYGYILTYSRLYRENVYALCSHQMGL